MAARQWAGERIVIYKKARAIRRQAKVCYFDIRGAEHVTLEFPCTGRNHGVCFFVLLRHDCRDIGLQDTGLLACDRRKSSSQIAS